MKQLTKIYCLKFLEQMNIKQAFTEKEFNRIYRRGGANANPLTFALRAADIFKQNQKTN